MEVEAFLLRVVPLLPKLNSVDGQMVMRDLYEAEYGIFQHLRKDKKRPLASVAFHPAENVIQNSRLEESIRTYTQRGIKETFGLSLIEFMDLPMDVVNLLLEIADETANKKARLAEDVERSIGLDKLKD